MATLLELNTLEMNSIKDPGGDPTAEPPVPPDAEIVAARELRAKVRSAVLKRAGLVLETELPADPDLRSPALEQVAWAQSTMASPDPMTGTAFRLVLVGAATATPTQILGASDAAIEAALTPVLGLLVKGMFPAGV